MDASDKVLFPAINFTASRSIADEIYVYIRHLIITEALPPHYVFPNENEMCQMLGTGRSTLREAYKALEASGFISRSKRGTRVNDAQSIACTIPFSMAIEMSDSNDLIEFRAMIEAELAALAARRATPDNIAQLRKCTEQMVSNQRNLLKLTQYDTEFHIEVAHASHNHLLINTMHMAVDSFFRGVYEAFLNQTEAMIASAIQYHHNILFAIESGEESVARTAMRSHVEKVKQQITAPRG